MTESAAAKRRRLTPARTGQGWYLPRPVRRFGGRLMEQQVWCWGRDVECQEGNLLIGFGFERYRDRETEDRSTCYRLDQDQLHICLWGFGMFFGRRDLGGLYLNRFDICPKWAPVESLAMGIHWPDELPPFARPQGLPQWQRARELWTSLLLWIAGYETWVRAQAGLAYRRECVETWLRPFVRPEKTAAAWRFLSRQAWESKDQPLRKMLEQYTMLKRPR
ncbi:MAG: hypothetical protein MK108_02165 [Mariniblastus sp.]|nr:hypothetical protein [Mariniblastus sp.]